MKDINIAAVNFRAVFGDIGANLNKIEAWTERLAQQGTEVICFPEMCICGYDRTAAIRPLSQPIPGPATDRLVTIAARHSVALLAGLAEADAQNQRFISHVLATPRGLAGVYHKTHLGPLEREVFTAGDEIGVFVHDGCTFGVQLCYDSHFPEWSTLQALAGAEVLFIAFASPRDDPQTLRDRLLRYLPARAYDNGCYVVACNLVGAGHRGQIFAGVALALDPKGKVLAEASGWEEGAALARLTGSETDRIHQTKMGYFLQHRRPDLYEGLCNIQSTERERNVSMLPHEIERNSFRIIHAELGDHKFSENELAVIVRVIHATADFDFRDNIRFHPQAVSAGITALRRGCAVVTDVRMVEVGISAGLLSRLGGRTVCDIRHPEVYETARQLGLTRSTVAMRRNAQNIHTGIVAIGNAPTALLEVIRLVREEQVRPALIVGVPVGFVNAVESKAKLLMLQDVPYITTVGRKGGSTVAVSIVNALLRLATRDT